MHTWDRKVGSRMTEDEFWARAIVQTDGCWLWDGTPTYDGMMSKRPCNTMRLLNLSVPVHLSVA